MEVLHAHVRFAVLANTLLALQLLASIMLQCEQLLTKPFSSRHDGSLIRKCRDNLCREDTISTQAKAERWSIIKLIYPVKCPMLWGAVSFLLTKS